MRHAVAVLFFLWAFCPLISAQAGTITPTGSMVQPRRAHTSTLLFDGRVLIAGGADGPAEVYDPASGTFRATGSLPDGFAVVSATLLANGNVLVVGERAAFLFDPVSEAFSPTGGLSSTQLGHQATLLKDGRVLITGSSDSAEVYDPSTGVFRAVGAYTGLGVAGLGYTAAAPLPDGRVLIATEPFAGLYDPVIDTFRRTGSMVADTGVFGKPTFLGLRRATLLNDGRVLLNGGTPVYYDTEEYYPLRTAELYTAATGDFTRTGEMLWPRYAHAVTLLTDGKVLVVGGWVDGHANSVYEVEAYDPDREAFSVAAMLDRPRLQPGAVLLNDGRVLITGGDGGLRSASASAVIYTPPEAAQPLRLLSLSGDGRGQAAIQHAGTHRIASGSDPAAAGEYLTVYATGLLEGSAIPPRVSIGGKTAEITYFGSVAGFAGLGQINLRVPAGVAAGGEIPVRLLSMGRVSNEVTIGVR